MVDVVADSAHEVLEKTIDFVMSNGHEREVWGGTIPEDLDDEDAPGDFERAMVEYVDGFSYKLTNPTKRWCEHSNHWPGITLREVEDDLCCMNPGMVAEYSKVYEKSWLEDTPFPQDQAFPHTYGERMFAFGSAPTRDDGRGVIPQYNQWDAARRMLEKNPSTRKAIIDLWDPHVDGEQMHDEKNAYVPCNIMFQLRVVEGKLNWKTHARSKDVLRGITENLFEFTLLQQIMAKQLGVEVGTYVSHISNAHIYQEQIDDGYLEDEFLDPYDYWDGDDFTVDFTPGDPMNESTLRQFQHVDCALEDGDYDKALDLTRGISDPYWCSWKASLAAEWVRMNNDGLDESETRYLYEQFFGLIETPWKIANGKRAVREWGDLEWVYDNIPGPYIDEVAEWTNS